MYRKMSGIVFVSLLGAILLFSCAKDTEKERPNGSQQVKATNLRKVTLDVQGMTCSGCEYNVESTLKKVQGVTHVKADFASQTAEVKFKPEAATEEQLVDAVRQIGYSAKTKSCCASAAPSITNGREKLDTISVETLKNEFNASSERVRILSILSPNCPACQRGKDVVKNAFEKFESDNLKGFVVWLPMWTGDQASAAFVQAHTLQDNRIMQGWDGDKAIAKLFSGSLGIKGAAWDIYLVYAPGVNWEHNAPPVPTFWMHQLTEDAGADQQLCLDPGQLIDVIGDLIVGKFEKR